MQSSNCWEWARKFGNGCNGCQGEGRRKKEEGRRKKEEGRRKKEEGRREKQLFLYP
ncbi:hypothetical protein [Microcoleus sp. Pol10D4]|uniref:hypothetical protein n=1 Tax=Microcoleus sp. Pol10D4 TaxID=3055387 RepID=UPI002FCE9CC6